MLKSGGLGALSGRDKVTKSPHGDVTDLHQSSPNSQFPAERSQGCTDKFLNQCSDRRHPLHTLHCMNMTEATRMIDHN